MTGQLVMPISSRRSFLRLGAVAAIAALIGGYGGFLSLESRSHIPSQISPNATTVSEPLSPSPTSLQKRTPVSRSARRIVSEREIAEAEQWLFNKVPSEDRQPWDDSVFLSRVFDRKMSSPFYFMLVREGGIAVTIAQYTGALDEDRIEATMELHSRLQALAIPTTLLFGKIDFYEGVMCDDAIEDGACNKAGGGQGKLSEEKLAVLHFALWLNARGLPETGFREFLPSSLTDLPKLTTVAVPAAISIDLCGVTCYHLFVREKFTLPIADVYPRYALGASNLTIAPFDNYTPQQVLELDSLLSTNQTEEFGARLAEYIGHEEASICADYPAFLRRLSWKVFPQK
ncbi:MAG: hypothetical protein ACE5KO_05765 [Candidatus Bathyarchaeia archaeon]